MSVRIEPGDFAPALPADATELVFAPGVHRGPLVLTRSAHLRGEDGAVLDAAGFGSVVQVHEDDLELTLENLTLRGGHADAGAGVRLGGYSTLRLRGCTVEGCRAPSNTGGGAWAWRGTLVLEDCTFRDNAARAGSDVMATGTARVEILRGSYAGDLAAREGATLLLEDARVEGRLDVRGTTTRAPSVRLVGSAPAGGVHNDPVLPGVVAEDG